MGRVFREVREQIETKIEEPIIDWEETQEEKCRDEPCNWWTLCLNKVFCWLILILVKIIRFVLVTVLKWVTTLLCDIFFFLWDLQAFLILLVMSIPIIGGIFRTILNWATEFLWRFVGIIDFIASLLGFRPQKKMYFGIIIPTHKGIPITTEAALQPQITAAIQHMNHLCNVNLIYTGACNSGIDAPFNPFTYSCDTTGFFSDWLLHGSFFEFTSALCKFEDGWRRLSGYGAEIIVFVVDDVTPRNIGGCSMGPTTNYVLTEAYTKDNMIVHEIGHACFLIRHHKNTNNLMHSNVDSIPQTLTDWQISVLRSSRHCVYI